jgi:hypothetical protein
MTDFPDFLAKYHAAANARRKASDDNLKANILPVLAKAGVAKVVAEYSGYGDSGAIDGISYLDSNDNHVALTGEAACLTGLEDALYEYLPAGFEINDGGQGTLTVHVKEGRVELDHGENYTETRSSYEEFEL